MEILKEEKDGKKVIELVKEDKHLKISLTKFDELSLNFSYNDEEKGNIYQETFDIDKEDGDVYKAVDGTFLSYSGDVFFDTIGANVMLLNNEGSYTFVFMKEYHEGTQEIDAKFIDDSMENSSMKLFFDELNNNTKAYEKPKTLSKTLKKIVEK